MKPVQDGHCKTSGGHTEELLRNILEAILILMAIDHFKVQKEQNLTIYSFINNLVYR